MNDHASVEEAVKAAREALGSIDVLVNNAVDWDVAFRDKNPDARLYQWQNALRANLEAPYLATVLAAPEMRRRWRPRHRTAKSHARAGSSAPAYFGISTVSTTLMTPLDWYTS